MQKSLVRLVLCLCILLSSTLTAHGTAYQVFIKDGKITNSFISGEKENPDTEEIKISCNGSCKNFNEKRDEIRNDILTALIIRDEREVIDTGYNIVKNLVPFEFDDPIDTVYTYDKKSHTLTEKERVNLQSTSEIRLFQKVLWVQIASLILAILGMSLGAAVYKKFGNHGYLIFVLYLPIYLWLFHTGLSAYLIHPLLGISIFFALGFWLKTDANKALLAILCLLFTILGALTVGLPFFNTTLNVISSIVIFSLALCAWQIIVIQKA